jgi:hypothetical protein
MQKNRIQNFSTAEQIASVFDFTLHKILINTARRPPAAATVPHRQCPDGPG